MTAAVWKPGKWNGVLVVTDTLSFEDELAGRPLEPKSTNGRLIGTMLREVGIDPNACMFTAVCREKIPGDKFANWCTASKKVGVANDWPHVNGRWAAPELLTDIEALQGLISQVEPLCIVGLGDGPLWALMGEWGIDAWRGSEMRYGDVPFVPTLHPTNIIRSWATRAFATTDLKMRVARRLRSGFHTPVWNFNIAPTLDQIAAFLEWSGESGSENGPIDVALDVETSRGQIVCIGIAWSERDAMCIPFINDDGAYWDAETQHSVITLLCDYLRRPTINVIGQNFQYDASYFEDNFGWFPVVSYDTYIAESVLFPGNPRGLGHLSSLYCSWHTYWKDDARDWNNLSDYAGLFKYNLRDVCATWEVAQVQRKLLAAAHLTPQFEDRMNYSYAVYCMMQRGVIRDETRTAQLDEEIEEALQERKLRICDAAGYVVNPTSPAQVSKLIYNEWGCRKPARRGKEAGGTGDEELQQVIKWHPERNGVLTAVLEHRSLASMRSNFLRAKLDPDGRLRSGFMATGTETFRITSSKNNFRRGTNLLNISGSGTTHSGNKVPNFRTAIVPPVGFTYFDCDLPRADLQIVAWEADDADLKDKFREGVDIHTENAKDIFGGTITPEQRERGKTFVHLTNYGGKARTCAIQVGCTVHEADMAQRRWFGAHPGIPAWHKRIEQALITTRTIYNKFGYRRVYFDRVEGLLPQALAWIPQSTIAIVASKIHAAFENIGGVMVELQCYDSVAGCYPTVSEDACLLAMDAARSIVIPYDDPLIIAPGIKTSVVSWGDCKDRKWMIG